MSDTITYDKVWIVKSMNEYDGWTSLLAAYDTKEEAQEHVDLAIENWDKERLEESGVEYEITEMKVHRKTLGAKVSMDWSMLKNNCKHCTPGDYFECNADPEMPQYKCLPENCPMVNRGGDEDDSKKNEKD